MVTCTTRPMTAQERALVTGSDRAVGQTTWKNTLVAAAFLGVFIGALAPLSLGFILPHAWLQEHLLMLHFAVGVPVMIITFIWLSLRNRSELTHYQADLAAGLVEERRYTALGALRVRDTADTSGDAVDFFYLDLGADQLLLLCGDYLKGAIAAGEFPCRSFSLIRLPHAGEVLRVSCHGGPCPTETTTDQRYFFSEKNPDDGGTLRASFATLPAVLALADVSVEDE